MFHQIQEFVPLFQPMGQPVDHNRILMLLSYCTLPGHNLHLSYHCLFNCAKYFPPMQAFFDHVFQVFRYKSLCRR
jgi:hypothetical protein